VVSKKEKYLVSAQKFMERGQLDKAVAEFAKVIEEDPKDTRTLLKLAEVHAKRGANAEATGIYLRTGDLYAEQGFAQKAVAVYKNVLKLSPALSPESVHAHLKVATLFVQLGLVSDAVQQFELAAAGLQRGSKPTEAVAALRQAVEIQPDNVVLRVKLAEGASHAGLIDEAVREFGVAADQLKLQGRLDESLRVMERLLFHQPDNFAKARELAEAYVAKGSPRLALPKLQACLNLDPHDPAILSLLARALELLGQIPKAVSVLKELVRLCEELGRPSERDAAVLRGLTLDPSDEELREAAARQQPLGGELDAADESTPPPVVARSVRTGTESSGVVIGQTQAYRSSDRVWEPASLQETSRGQQSQSGVSGVSLAVLPDVGRILAEAEVFVKYGLLERAADHLIRVFESESEPQSRSASEAGLVASAPVYREAREKLIAVLQQLGRREDAARHAAILAASLAEARQEAEVPDGFDGNGHAPREISLDFDPAQLDALASPSAFSSSVAGAVEGSSSSSGPTRSLEIASYGGQGFDAFDDPAAGILTPPPTPTQRPEVGARQVELDVRGQANVDGEADADADASWPQKEHTVTDDDIKDAAPSGRSQQERQPGLEEGRQQDDPSRAFSDDVPTITGDPELAVEALAEVDEEDLDAELAQVSFFLDQAMTDEARALLEDLQARFPADPRIMARVRELRNSDFRALAQSSESITTARIVHQPTLAALASLGSLGATAIDRPSPRDPTPTPRVVVRGGDSDSATHADLAIAYKGMGLLDAAIAELKLLVQDPAREVFALTTMGECFEGKGSFTEAIIRYKRALNCEQITAEETLVLYFLLGAAFERLGDVSEALYFFEKVLKRDPRFRDVDLRVAELRPRLVKRAR